MQPTVASVFDKVAQTYWQDYERGNPIGGGMSFEKRLRDCALDDTLESLKRLDGLLSAIKSELSTLGKSESELLRQSSFRNFLLFVGFYAGRVVAKVTGKPLTWVALADLGLTVPAGQNKFYSVAGLCPRGDTRPVLFIWLTLGAKFFGNFQRKFLDPATQMLVPESVYWAVQTYIEALASQPKATTPPAPVQPVVTPVKPSAVPTVSPSVPTTTPTAPSPTVSTSITTPPVAPSQPTTLSSSKPIAPKPTAPKTDIVPVATPTNAPATAKQAPKALNTPIASSNFTEVYADLRKLSAVNTMHNAHYQQAVAVIEQAMQDLTNAKKLSETQKNNLKNALSLLQKVANAGNTNAMLSLALVFFEGKLLKTNNAQAVQWVQRAAEVNDARAQKFLSRLYYQGLGVAMSPEMGATWLSRAAANGHAEAIKLQQQFKQVELLKDDFRVEAKKDKQYLVVLIVVMVIAIVCIWLLAKFASN